MRRAPHDLESFYSSQYRRVLGTLALYLGDPHAAEEIAQDAFVRVCRDWHKVRAMEAPGVWVHRVAMNLATSRFGRRAAERRANERAFAHLSACHRDDEAAIATRLTVLEAIAGLPSSERSALILRYYTGLSVRETAQVLGRPTGTIKTWTHRAVHALRSTGVADLEDEEVTDGG